ncbi:MAG: peptidase S41, partial [Bacteroidia bacterium]
FLPNGWTYRYPIQISIDPAGTILDGDGQAPEVYSKNTPADIDNGVDRVLEDAIQYLFDEYGIE